jgi:hypothetical protein
MEAISILIFPTIEAPTKFCLIWQRFMSKPVLPSDADIEPSADPNHPTTF